MIRISNIHLPLDYTSESQKNMNILLKNSEVRSALW